MSERETASDPEGRCEEEPRIISLAMAWGSTWSGLVVVVVVVSGLGGGTEVEALVVVRPEFRMRRRPEPLTVEK